MGEGQQQYRLFLTGAFRLETPLGTRILISSKRGQALLAMLATASGGERTRSWLQTRLWGSRDYEHGRASLRREISTLRQTLAAAQCNILQADNSRAWIDLAAVTIDVRNDETFGFGEFLEGLDIAGEEAFEDWLREERGRLHELADATHADGPLTRSNAAPFPESAPAFAGRSALAVLRFASDGGAESAAVAEGISEDLIDRLSRLRWVPVIARSSSFALDLSLSDARSAGAALGVRYVIEGRLRGEGDGYLLSAALVDADGGQTLWSNRVAINATQEGDALDELLTGIAAALGLSIDNAEQQRAIRKPASDLNVSDLIWKGRWHLNRLTSEDSAIAKHCFEQALEREPSSPEALIQATTALFYSLWTQRADEDEIRRFRKMAQRAIVADLEDARGYMLAGIAEIWLRQPLRAEALLSRAIEMNPSLYLAHAELGSALYLRGDPEKAIEVLHTALRLSPNDSTLFYIYGELGMAHLMLDHFDAAIESADRAIMLRHAYWYGHGIKVCAYASKGDIELARNALSELKAAVPNFNPAFADWLPFIEPRWNDFLKKGLNL